jgi:plastocyanin
MRVRARVLIGAAALAALLALPAGANAQATWTVDARDLGPGLNVWDPDVVEAEQGDTVSWEFDEATQGHNLFLALPDDSVLHLSAPPVCPGDHPTFGGICAPGAPAIDYDAFNADGVYTYFCTIHGGDAQGNGMAGNVLVGDIEPPPGPLPNPTDPPGPPWETGDNERPELTGLKARGIRHGASLRFTLSEPGKVKVAFKRAGKTVYRGSLRGLDAGKSTRKIRHQSIDAGRHRVTLVAVDEAGNRSRPRSASVNVK